MPPVSFAEISPCAKPSGNNIKTHIFGAIKTDWNLCLHCKCLISHLHAQLQGRSKMHPEGLCVGALVSVQTDTLSPSLSGGLRWGGIETAPHPGCLAHLFGGSVRRAGFSRMSFGGGSQLMWLTYLLEAPRPTWLTPWGPPANVAHLLAVLRV